MTGTKLKLRRSKVRWEGAVGVRKSCEASTALAVAWRRCARRAEDVARLRRRAGTTQQAREATADADQHAQALLAHRAAIKAAKDHLPPGVPSQLKDELDRWATHFSSADATESAQWLQSLVDLADKKAAKLESEAKKKRLQDWSTAVGAAPVAGNRTPTRLAYRWVKGFTGWSKSPTGSDSANNEVPEEPGLDEDCQQERHEEDVTKGEIERANEIPRYNGSACLVPLCDKAAVDKEANM